MFMYYYEDLRMNILGYIFVGLTLVFRASLGRTKNVHCF